MFHHHGKKSRPAHIKPLHDLTTITTATTLLGEGKRPALMEKITDSCALDTSRFNTLCLKLLHNFTNHCQSLPETAHSYYAQPCGLLDHALNRTEAALHLLREHMIQGTNAELSEEQKLWVYALFSAGILQGIGKLQLDYRIELYDVNRHLLKKWNPLLENLTSIARYFHYEFTISDDENQRRRLNLLLARQLMPENGFAWIAGNPKVLSAWLALLNEDPYDSGMLAAILERADAIAIQRDLDHMLLKHNTGGGAKPGRIGTVIDTPVESDAQKEQALGADFIKWLISQVDKGVFVMNKIPLVMIPAGVLMSPETYKIYMREHPVTKNWQAIEKSLVAMGLHHDKEAQITHSEKHDFLLKKLAVILPDNVQVHNPATGKVSTVSAVALLHMHHTQNTHESVQHLSLSGEWQAIGEHSPALQTGPGYKQE